MKILIAHNDYGRHSGEEAVVDKMKEMMKAHGHEICFYRPSTAAYQHGLLSKVQVFLSGLYSYRGVRGMRKVLRRENPDIVNIHNLYPFISPAALFACKSAGIPIVMTVHNYRLVCPTGLFLRDGHPCEHCLQQWNEWGCVRYNCEKDVAKSIGYALREYVARKTGAYRKNVDRYVCLTAFQQQKLIEAGFRAEKITVIPNSVAVPRYAPGAFVDAQPGTFAGARPGELAGLQGAAAAPGGYIAYVGRLSEEKGWDLLEEIAGKHPELRIDVAGAARGETGSGRDVAGSVRGEATTRRVPANINFSGQLGKDELTAFYRQARFLVIPSRCYEGLPLVALEAMAMGKPVIAPDHGGFPELIGKGSQAIGCLFRPGDRLDLEACILKFWRDDALVQEMGRRCVEKMRTAYSSEMIYRQWERLFLDLLKTRKN